MDYSWREVLVGLPVAADIGLRITAVLAIAWIIHLALARDNPLWRMLLWRCAVVGVVLIPVLVFSMPRLQLAVQRSINHGEASAANPEASPFAATFHNSEGLLGTDSRPPMDSGRAEQFGVESPPLSVRAAEKSPSVGRFDPWAFLLIGWLLGFVALAVRWCSAQVGVWKKVSHCYVAPIECRRVLEQIASRIGCSRQIRLLMSDDLDVPFAAGVSKAVIVLPSRMCTSDYASELPGILAHELCHHQSRDLAWMGLLQWIQILGWVHPLVWRIRKAHAMACEEVADATAAEFVGDVQHYSGILARMALSARSGPPLAAAVSMARRPEIMTRLARLRRGLRLVPLTRGSVYCMVAAGILGLVGLAGFKFVLADSQKTTEAGSRVIRFPSDRSVGKLWIATAEEPRWRVIQHAVDYHQHWEWVYPAQAKGAVTIPAGAKVKLQLSSPGAQDMSWTSQLAAEDLHTLEVIGEGWGGLPFGDAQIRHLKPLTGVQELELRAVQVSDRGLQALERLQSLRLLVLNAPQVGNEGLKSLGRLKTLEVLSLAPAGKWTGAGLAHLSKLKSLREFSFDAKNVPGAALTPIARIPSLIYVWSGEGFGDEHLLALKAATSLKGLRIQGANVTDEGLRHLAEMNNLEYLDLWGTGISDAGLVHLKALPSLKRLNVRVKMESQWPLITSRGIAQLAEIPSLEQLDLPNIGMTDECCKPLSRLTNLRHLWIGCSSNSPITNEGLRHLAGLRLESLSIAGTGITDEGLSHVAGMKTLRSLGLSYAPQVSNAGLAKLGSLRSLETLYLPAPSRITVSGLNQVNGLPHLRVLNLSTETPFNSEQAVLDISGLTELQQLTIPAFRDADLACLSKLKHLESLMLSGSGIGDTGATHLARVSSLTRLSIGGPEMTDAGLASLTGLSSLTDLYVTGSFSDQGVACLKRLSGLEVVVIRSTQKLGSQAKESLKKGLPNLRMLTVDADWVLTTEKRSELEGRIAPRLTATTLDGKNIELDAYRGKVVLLYFWATSCKPCMLSMPDLKRSYAKVRKEHPDFEMIGISTDDSDLLVKQNVAKNQLPWTQVRIGEKSRIASDYGVRGVPRYVLIDRSGRVQHDGDADREFEKKLMDSLRTK